MTMEMTAKQFVKKLETLRSATELKKIQRYFKTGEGQYAEGDEFIGVRMGQAFALAKEFMEMPLRILSRMATVSSPNTRSLMKPASCICPRS